MSKVKITYEVSDGYAGKKSEPRIGIVGDVAVTKGDWLTGKMTTKRYMPAQYVRKIRREHARLAKRASKEGANS